MNAAEKIVEAYFRHVKGLFTRSSLRGKGQSELDIVGVDPRTIPPTFYHIESSVSISSFYDKIINKPYDEIEENNRGKKAAQRTTAGFFINKKFFHENVIATLKQNGCDCTNIKRILVAWRFTTDAQQALEKKNIKYLTMKEIFQDLVNHLASETTNLDSEILRTIQLFVRSQPDMPDIYSIATTRKKKKQKINSS